MGRLFGTDGIRGLANKELTCELAFKLGQAAARCLGSKILIGKDTRRSGDMLEAAVVAGLTSAGADAYLVGVIPTPAVALLTRDYGCDAGVVISASHNPAEYNGIKFFNSQGFKLSDELEACVEAYVLDGVGESELPDGLHLGSVKVLEGAHEHYINHAILSLASTGEDLSGIRVVLDVAHGAAATTSAEALRRLGAEVTLINEDFDGLNINENCGSTHLEALQEALAEHEADLGIAHDGDADRVLFLSPTGELIDGDFVLAVCAQDLQAQGKLAGNTVVSTVMCNLGLVHRMRELGLELIQTKVGDRFVLEEMLAQGLALGGEQSGHTIFLEHNSTGDGLVTAIQFMGACKRLGLDFAQAAQAMKRYPQCLINVAVSSKEKALAGEELARELALVEAELGQEGRVLLRPSGTEPLVRVMVEAATEEAATSFAERLAACIRRAQA